MRRDEQFIGWHYTSIENWKAILKQGLVPRRIPEHLRKKVDKALNCEAHGTWAYRKQQHGWSLLGVCMYHVCHKDTRSVVCLKLKYTGADILMNVKGQSCYAGMKHDLTHERTIFHIQEPAHLIQTVIKPENIELVSLYNMDNMMEQYEGYQAPAKTA